MSGSSSSTGDVVTVSASAIWRRRAIDRGRLLHARAVAAVPGRAVAGAVRAVAAAVGRRRRRRADASALLTMSDRMLADIGLRRVDLQGVACGVIPADQVASRPPPAPPRDNVEELRPGARSRGRSAAEELGAAA